MTASDVLARAHVAVLVDDMYEDLELWYPVMRLRAAGAEVSLIGDREGKVYSGRCGYPALSDIAIEDARSEEFDALIIPGGYAPDRMRRHPKMVELVRDINARHGVIAAICHAGWMLVEADILAGRKATCFFSIRRDLENGGATFVDEPVVEDGNLITSRTPDDLPLFGEAIVRAIAARQRREPTVSR